MSRIRISTTGARSNSQSIQLTPKSIEIYCKTIDLYKSLVSEIISCSEYWKELQPVHKLVMNLSDP
jgi:hypothetical protein